MRLQFFIFLKDKRIDGWMEEWMNRQMKIRKGRDLIVEIEFRICGSLKHQGVSGVLHSICCGTREVPNNFHLRYILHCYYCSFIHSFIQSFVRSFIHSFIRSFVHSIVRSFILSFVRTFIHSFIHSFTMGLWGWNLNGTCYQNEALNWSYSFSQSICLSITFHEGHGYDSHGPWHN